MDWNPMERNPQSVSEWEEPSTHSEKIPGGLQRMVLLGKKIKVADPGWGSLALPSPLLASFPLPLWALEGVGWPKGCADTDATSQVPRSIWNLLYFNLSTPTAWPQRRATQASPPSLETHLLNSSCHPGVFHIFCFPSLGPQFEGPEWLRHHFFPSFSVFALKPKLAFLQALFTSLF